MDERRGLLDATITRRRLVRLAAGSAAAALIAPLLTACGGGGAPGPAASGGASSSSAASATKPAAASSSAPAAASSEQLVLGITPIASQLDPRITAGMPNHSHQWHMYESLVWHDEKMDTIPWLAGKWEQVDPRTMKLSLRQGVKFHNGEDFSAETVKWTIDNIRAPESKSGWKSMMTPVAEVKVIDGHTVHLVSQEPNRALLRNLFVIPMLGRRRSWGRRSPPSRWARAPTGSWNSPPARTW